MYQEPSSHRVCIASGNMTGGSGFYEKRLKDLDGIYLNDIAFRKSLEHDAERVVYTVHEKRPAQASGDLIFGTTYMEPGQIGDEYFMTRGHIHACANRPEVYYGESGHGVMLLESPEGDHRLIDILPRVIVYVPPYWIHRSINIGNEPLVMSFFYPNDAGQDYEVIKNSNGMVVRVVADGKGWKSIPNPNYLARSSDQIEAIFRTAKMSAS